MPHSGCHYFAQNFFIFFLTTLSLHLQYRLLERKVLRMDYVCAENLISSMAGCISISKNAQKNRRNIKRCHHRTTISFPQIVPPFMKHTCLLVSRIKADVTQTGAGTFLLFIAAAAMQTDRFRAPPLQTLGEARQALAKQVKVTLEEPPLQGPLCISSPSRRALPCQNLRSHLSCKRQVLECQRMKRQWHLPPQRTHQMPIVE